MYKSIMMYLTDKDLSLNAKGFLSMILFNDETSSHMHIVGGPIKDDYKNVLSMQVCKSKVFNKTFLIKLQD